MSTGPASALVVDHIALIRQCVTEAPALDLACGSGRNGAYLLSQGVAVMFADRDGAKLDEIAQGAGKSELATTWEVDFEKPGQSPLEGRSFPAILVFRYLHRPLMPAIKHAIHPGGLIVYETFTTDHPRFGRPTNPDYLLKPKELEQIFSGWEILHSFEGESSSETGGRPQAIAQIVARKPAI